MSARVLLVIGMAAVLWCGWVHVRSMSVASASANERRDTWTRRMQAPIDNERERTTDDFHTISGAVQDELGRPVADAEIALIDLTTLDAAANEVTLVSAVPSGSVVARTSSGEDGTYAFLNVTNGPKAVLARTPDGVSASRWVARVIEGVPNRALDIRIAHLETQQIEVSSVGFVGDAVAYPVLDEFYLAPQSAAIVSGDIVSLQVPAGPRPDRLLIIDGASNIAKLFPVEYSGKRPYVRCRIDDVEIPAAGTEAGTFSGELDDLDYGLSGVASFQAAGDGEALRLRVPSGRVGVTVKGADWIVYATVSVDGRTGVSVVSEVQRFRPCATSLDISRLVGRSDVSSCWALMLSDEPTIGWSEDRLSLIRRAARMQLMVENGVVSIGSDVAVRRPVLLVETRTKEVYRAMMKVGADGVVGVADPRHVSGGSVFLDLPRAYSRARLVSDDGTVWSGRSGASGELRFDSVSLRVPFVVFADESPFGWNKHAVAGGWIGDGREVRLSVDRRTERPSRSWKAEIFGFVKGATSAHKVTLFCQPYGDPRGTRVHTCVDSPFFDFVVEPGRGYSVVAAPGDEQPSETVEYLRAVADAPALKSAEYRRVDIALGKGSLSFAHGDSLVGKRLQLVRVDKGRVAAWSWAHKAGMELRNVPEGRYVVCLPGVGTEERDVSAEFTLEDFESEVVTLRDE